MNLDKRLAAAAALVPRRNNLLLADIGTDHAYLPAAMVLQGRVSRAVAGDIAAGPCDAARRTVALYGVRDKVQVRQGSGLEVLRGEDDAALAACTIVIAGMGAGTIIEILQNDLALAHKAQSLVLQPMAGAALLRRWLLANSWRLVQEDLVEDGQHFYELMRAEPVGETDKAGFNAGIDIYGEAALLLGPMNIAERHKLLPQHIRRQQKQLADLLASMERSAQARQSEKYRRSRKLLEELEVLAENVCGSKAECNCK